MASFVDNYIQYTALKKDNNANLLNTYLVSPLVNEKECLRKWT